MAIVLPKQPSLGEITGASLGQGLQALAESKLKQIQQRNLAQQLEHGYNFSPEEAQAFTQLPQELQPLAFKQRLQAPQQQTFAQLLGQLQGGQGQPLNIPEGAGLNEKQALDLAKFGQKERQIGAAEKKESRKYLQPFAEAANKRRESIQQNQELKKVALSGNLRAGNVQQLLDATGWGQFNQPLENAVAQKNLAAQASNAAAAYGTSRLNIFAEKTYAKSLGTLWNTPEGLYTVASLNNLRSKATDAIDKARNDIIRENKGETPFDIEALARERAQPTVDKYAKKSMEVVTNAAQKYLKAQHKLFASKNKPTSYDTPKEILKAGYRKGDRFQLAGGGIEVFDGRKMVPESEYQG
jgi:hypothetical protein